MDFMFRIIYEYLGFLNMETADICGLLCLMPVILAAIVFGIVAWRTREIE